MAHVPVELRTRSRVSWVMVTGRVVLFSSGFHLTFLYRLGRLARLSMGGPGRLIAGMCFWIGRHWYSSAVSPLAEIHGGLIMPHPQGIVIGSGAAIGSRAWVFHNVTVGGAPNKTGLPRIGTDVRLYAGAVVSGPVTLGDRVTVGANAVVHRNVPSDCIVRAPESSVES